MMKTTSLTTSKSYCKSCGKTFINGEVVYYIPINDNVVCDSCAEKSNSEAHPRIYEEDNE